MGAPAEQPDSSHPERLGEYTIDGVLGEGGFGIVYAARREGHALALKVLRSELDLSDSERARFLKEAQICKNQYAAEKPHVDAGVAAMLEREKKQAERAAKNDD